jgi:hypothetical protein
MRYCCTAALLPPASAPSQPSLSRTVSSARHSIGAWWHTSSPDRPPGDVESRGRYSSPCGRSRCRPPVRVDSVESRRSAPAYQRALPRSGFMTLFMTFPVSVSRRWLAMTPGIMRENQRPSAAAGGRACAPEQEVARSSRAEPTPERFPRFDFGRSGLSFTAPTPLPSTPKADPGHEAGQPSWSKCSATLRPVP